MQRELAQAYQRQKQPVAPPPPPPPPPSPPPVPPPPASAAGPRKGAGRRGGKLPGAKTRGPVAPPAAPPAAPAATLAAPAAAPGSVAGTSSSSTFGGGGQLVCSNCEDSPAVLRCHDCRACYCESCDSPLHLARLKRQHIRVPVEATASRVIDAAASRVIVLDVDDDGDEEPDCAAEEGVEDRGARRDAEHLPLETLELGLQSWLDGLPSGPTSESEVGAFCDLLRRLVTVMRLDVAMALVQQLRRHALRAIAWRPTFNGVLADFQAFVLGVHHATVPMEIFQI
jgi:hypothetical protein